MTVMSATCGVEGPHTHDAALGRDWISRVIPVLVAEGQRLTASRRAVLNQISQATAPFTAEQLLGDIEAASGVGSRSTVYRLLGWLRDRGWLVRVAGDHAEHVRLFRQFPGHYPATCTRCGGHILIGGMDLARAVAADCSTASFTVEGIRLELFGRCGQCAPEALSA
jgi:Fe2+ or Zn2+ uptake regulation protein